jgi:hypothetical protein
MNTRCNSGWTEIDGDCYAVVSDPDASYFDAYLTCTLNGGDLASILTENVQTEILTA